MPKKTQSFRTQEFRCKCYFRWEFIRRNLDYQGDYKIFRIKFRRWFKRRGVDLKRIHTFDGLFVDEFLNTHAGTEDYFFEKIILYVEAFRQKWGVSWPCDPDFSLDLGWSKRTEIPDLTMIEFPIRDLEPKLRPEMKLDRLLDEMRLKRKGHDLQSILEEAAKVDTKADPDNTFQFRIIPRLGKQKNKQRFFKYLDQIDWTRPRRPTSPSRKQTRQRLNQYCEYLRVWDFKHTNVHLKWPELSRMLYPEDYQKYAVRKHLGIRNAVTQRAIDRYARAKDLINGGFQEIT